MLEWQDGCRKLVHYRDYLVDGQQQWFLSRQLSPHFVGNPLLIVWFARLIHWIADFQ
ncbi:hypothetical protein INT80_08235 [Gallibacterium anatis]|uniref:Uncharacterized protein n=1 Tax=Gallibacterium anatis TaxID=750 RepID=A0A930USV3_9PAST|nr:hypothetical protein [Gallibacterium anatis]